MKNINDFNELIRNKKILYIPVISSINRDTKLYNLDSDGNINRIITTFATANSYSELIIFLPAKHTGGKYVSAFLRMCPNTKIYYSDNFGIHAGEQRNKKEVYEALIEEANEFNIDNFDYIICDSQNITLYFATQYPEKTIYLNSLMYSPGLVRIYTKGFEEFDKNLFNICKYVILGTYGQYNYYSLLDKDKIYFIDKYMDRSLPCFALYNKDIEVIKLVDDLKSQDNDMDIYYLPYRLSDEAYKLDDVLDYIKSHSKKYMILYADPNESHLLDNNIDACKVSSMRDTYYTLLDDGRITIPYFEDLDISNHCIIHEMLSSTSKCTILIKRQKYWKFNNERVKEV